MSRSMLKDMVEALIVLVLSPILFGGLVIIMCCGIFDELLEGVKSKV